ncbi:metalloregulator ArsR/SmtB family transcription factor [Archaeoglobus profundus]|uniref:Transcriptional regulator, ArsR family n=1 Tax=Archaeoglobus profundus (strain DSM 5631 / JCM 9629 / NBRC 100127 / Av18) TaxID=572546 RepID=D2RHV0_ARCPA|nr:metalloregulator ArsR/SmtB family transcription factor [Archaeoglobus profundus]ADB57875.1 transcriptional regulator, ArsR family [Archaeoglobus profundus DSM 5631]
MDVNELLDILGNESRRRILSLLAQKPCYVSEIAYCLKMAPKVVIEHLEKLEKAGIVKSFEEGKRRYYYIDKSFRLEVTLSPYRFSAKVVENGNIEKNDLVNVMQDLLNLRYSRDISSITETLSRIERMQDVLSRIQCYVNSKINEIMGELLSAVEKFTNDEIEKLVLYGLAKGLRELEIAEYFGLMYSEVESALKRLEERGLIERVVEGGRIVWKFRR